MQRLLRYSLVRFCLVGILGFATNFVLLTLLYRELHWRLFIAQMIASEIALFNNFLFHHRWTYKGHVVRKTIPRLLLEFHATSWVAILGSAVMVSLGVSVFHLSYTMALIIASIVALGWNFGWSRFVIWREHEHPAIVD